jgi:acyl-CoA thioester hydrolase
MSDLATAVVSVPIETRYYQFDQQGVVFNMWYLAYVEDARNGFLAARGFSLQDLLDSGRDIQLVHSTIDWVQAVRYGDELVIDVALARVGRTSLGLDFTLTVEGSVTARASTVYVIVHGDVSGKTDLPDGLRAALTSA